MAPKSDLMQGTLDMLVLRVLSRGELHGCGITQRLEQLSAKALQVSVRNAGPRLHPEPKALDWARLRIAST